MQLDSQMIENLIRQNLPKAQVRVEDVRGDGRYYAISVVAADFRGMHLTDQHRMVFASLYPTMGDDLESSVELTTRAA